MEQQAMNNLENEDELSLVEIARALVANFKWIVVSMLVCVLLAVGYFVVADSRAGEEIITEEPTYTAQTTVYYLTSYLEILEKAGTNFSMETVLTADLKAFATSHAVVDAVIEDLALEVTYAELLEKVTVSVPTNTHMLTILVQDEDPALAMEISSAMSTLLCGYVEDVMELSAPIVFEEVVLEDEQEEEETIVEMGLDIIMVVFMAAFIGLCIACGVILLYPILASFAKEVFAKEEKAA